MCSSSNLRSGAENIIHAQLDINYMLASAIIGVPLDVFHDLMDYDNEIWGLTVEEFLRYSLLRRIQPISLLPSDAARIGTLFVSDREDEQPQLTTSERLRQLIEDLPAVAEAIGWEADALNTWLLDDLNIGKMNMTALNDLCLYIKIDIGEVLINLWRSIGQN